MYLSINIQSAHFKPRHCYISNLKINLYRYEIYINVNNTIERTEIVGFDSGIPDPVCVVIYKGFFITNLKHMVLTLPVAVKNFCGAIFPIYSMAHKIHLQNCYTMCLHSNSLLDLQDHSLPHQLKY